jgi:hypothetical protein
MNSSWMRPASEAPLGPDRRPPKAGVAITRIVNLPPDWAELALQAALPRVSAEPYRRVIGGMLQVSTRTLVDDGNGACRRLRGTLVSRRGRRRIPVELELSGRSPSATDLTLRPLRSGRWPGWSRWYLTAGTALVDLIVDGTGGSDGVATPAAPPPEVSSAPCSPATMKP